MNESKQRPIQRNDAATDLITSGHVWKAVWFLAWPTAISTLIQTAYNIINGAFVGRLPDATNSLAAVNFGGTALMIQYGLTIALSVGTSALVARHLGARDHDNADEAMRQSLMLCVFGGMISGLPFILWANQIVKLIGADRVVVPIAGDYTSIIAWFTIPSFFYVIITAALRSAGDVRSPLYIGAIVLSLNAILDRFFIFGIGPIPMMGVHGAAISTGISSIVAMFVSFLFLKRSVLGGALSHFRLHSGLILRILNIGWPAAIQNLLWTTASAGFLKVLALLPVNTATPAQAALGVSLRIEALAFMPGVAYSMAATPLIGQNLGAGKPDRAVHSAWVAVGQAVAIMSIVAISFIVIPKWLALIFTPEKEVVGITAAYLRINSISEPFLAVAMVLRGALQGAGDTRVPALISVTTLWLVRLPVAFVLAVPVGLGANGAWIAMSGSTILSGILMATWFNWGKWKSAMV